MEVAHQVRTLGADRIPEDGVQWLEQARTPGGDRELSARLHLTPQTPGGRGHVGNEEDAEHAHHRVERLRWIGQREEVAAHELEVGEAPAPRLVTRERQQVVREIHADHAPLRAGTLGRRQRRGAAPAAGVEHAHAARDADPLDRAPAEALTEPERGIVVAVGAET